MKCLRLFSVILACLGVVSTSVAGPVTLSGEIGYGCFAQAQRHHGGYGAVGVDALIGDVFGVVGQYSVSDHRSKGDAQRVHRLALGPLVALDAFEYIPWASLKGGAILGRGDHLEKAVQFDLSFGVGFDRLLSEDWALGLSAQFSRILGHTRFPAYMLLGLRMGYRWGSGGALAP